MAETGRIKIQTTEERAKKLRRMVFHVQKSDPSATLRSVLEAAVDEKIAALTEKYGEPVDVPDDVRLRAGRRIGV